MPNFNAMFKTEVGRLARREVRPDVLATKKAQAQHRRDIAALKREVAGLRRTVTFLEGRERQRLGTTPPPEAAQGVRFSPKWLKAHRSKLGLSAADYARMVGVSPLSVYNWESGKTKPQAKQIAAWAQIRGLGKREALKRLEMLGG